MLWSRGATREESQFVEHHSTFEWHPVSIFALLNDYDYFVKLAVVEEAVAVFCCLFSKQETCSSQS